MVIGLASSCLFVVCFVSSSRKLDFDLDLSLKNKLLIYSKVLCKFHFSHVTS